MLTLVWEPRFPRPRVSQGWAGAPPFPWEKAASLWSITASNSPGTGWRLRGPGSRCSVNADLCFREAISPTLAMPGTVPSTWKCLLV